MRRYDTKGSASTGGAQDRKADEPGQRKLIRPNLSDMKDRLAPRSPRRKQAPPEQTNAEAFYYLKQMNSKTQMIVIMKDGEELRGIIEWYDRLCIKVNRQGAPNLMVMKDCIKYMFKAEELAGGDRGNSNDGM
jgi:sRNA-binding regulator protein Hfq